MEEIRNIISEEVARIFEEEEPKTIESLQRELNSIYAFAERMETELNESKLLLMKIIDKIKSESPEKNSDIILKEIYDDLTHWQLKA